MSGIRAIQTVMKSGMGTRSVRNGAVRKVLASYSIFSPSNLQCPSQTHERQGRVKGLPLI